MKILRLMIAGAAFAFGTAASAATHMPPAGPSGLSLEIAGQIDPYQMPITRNDGQVYDLSGRFYYARYVDTDLPEGSLERAKTAAFGVYFSAGGASRWVIKPEWSGLFPVNSDYAIVRKPGKDDWLSLQIDSGKTSKIGKGEVRIMDVLHREAMALHTDDPVYRYYMATADTGDTQTVTLLRWNNEKKRVETATIIPNVLSPANAAGLPPLQLTYDLDIIIRSRVESEGIREWVFENPTIRFGNSKKLDPYIPLEGGKGPFVFTAPSRLLLKVLDADQQLYLPYRDLHDADFILRAEADEYEGLLGVRPVGDRVTTDLKNNPLHHHEEAGLAALWKTKSGVRLAPLLQTPAQNCVDVAFDKAGCAILQGRIKYFDYPEKYYLKQSRENALYIAIEHIELPEEVRDIPGNDTRISAALRCHLPDGRIDIWAAMPYVANLRNPPVKMNPEPFATRKEADDFVKSVSYREGLYAYRIAENDKMFERIAEGWRVHEQKRRAALTQAQRDHEDLEEKWRQQREQRSADRTALVQSQLDAGNIEGAMDIAMEDWADLPKVVAYALERGRPDLVGDAQLRQVYQSSSYGKSTPAAAVSSEFFRRFPVAVRAAPSGYQWQSAASSSGAKSADPAPLYRAPDYQMESKMKYLSGQSSSYLCSSSSFCQ